MQLIMGIYQQFSPSPIGTHTSSAGLVAQAQSAGGTQEWSTDQGVDEKSIPDSDAKALKKKAMAEDVCVPIGEGENCW